MKAKLKIILLTLLTMLVIAIGLIGYNLYLMEIEDQYGDLQSFYHESRDGDIVLKRKTREWGVISKSWKRIRVVKNQKDTIDLNYWAYMEGDIAAIEIYRTSLNTREISKMEYYDVIHHIDESKAKLVVRN